VGIVPLVTSKKGECVLAVNLVGGTAYCAVVSSTGELLADALERIELAEGLMPAEQLADFAARFRQELSRLGPVAVGVINTRKYSGWKYADAWRRVTLEAAVMMTVAEASTGNRPVHYTLVKQETMAKAVEIPLAKLNEVATDRWGDQVTKYRKDRFPAVVGAMGLVREFCQ
jgi:hypothetical protein